MTSLRHDEHGVPGINHHWSQGMDVTDMAQSSNDPCELDLLPIDLEMVRDTSFTHGLY